MDFCPSTASAGENLTTNHTVLEILNHFSSARCVDKMVTITFHVVGLCANPLCAYFWLDSRILAKNSSAIYLGLLSLTHFAFLVFELMAEVRLQWNVEIYDTFCGVFTMLLYVPQYLAPLLVLAFTTERFLVVFYPFRFKKYCTTRNAGFVSACLLIFCLATACPQAFIWDFDQRSEYKVCNIKPEFSKNKFTKIWRWTSEILHFGIVHLVVLILNILFISKIRQMSRNSAAHTADSEDLKIHSKTLISVSLFLIVTQLPFTVVHSLQEEFHAGNVTKTIDEIKHDPEWERYFTYMNFWYIFKNVQLTNSVFYIVIYIISSKYFRFRMKHFFSCCARRTGSNNIQFFEIFGSQQPATRPTYV